MQLSLRTDRSLLRATARSTRYLQVTITAPTAPPRDDSGQQARPPVHIGIVLDRSGSMEGDSKYTLAMEAVSQALNMLGANDRFTVVIYDTEVDVIMPSTLATPRAKRDALRRLSDVGPRGGTDLYSGWMTGAAQMLEYFSRESVSRVLLLTDGLANSGVIEPSALVAAGMELRRRGIATSTFGVGSDFDERLLRDIAHDAGGQFYYIESPTQITDMLTSELGEALEVVHRDAVLELMLPPGAEAELLNRYRHRYAAGDHELRIELGDLVSAQELSLIVRLTFPEDREGASTHVRATIAGIDTLTPAAHESLSWVYAGHSANDVQPRDVVVDREVAQLYAARARAEATEANRRGDFRAARQVLEATARRIRSYAHGDPAMVAICRALLAEVEQYSERVMSPREQKQAFYAAEVQSTNRSPEGRKRRQAR